MSINRTLLLAVLATTGLGACQSVKTAMLTPPVATRANAQQLPALSLTAEAGPLVMSDGALPEDPLRMFKGEMQRSLMETGDTATYGYARLVITQAHTVRTGRVLHAFQLATFMVPSLLGVPLEWYKTDIEAEVQLLDANGELLGTYTGKGSSNVRVAMYSGYGQTKAPRLADVLALRAALAKIRPQLGAAVPSLRPRLLAAGTNSNPSVVQSSVR